jgi:hypothetical protein
MGKENVLNVSGSRLITRNQLVTLDDLEEFKRELLIGIQAIVSQNASIQPKKWMKTYEVKKMLNISHGTLQTLRNNGTIPFSKVGGIIYYDAIEINKVFEARKRDYGKNRKQSFES